jgi:hypothetical protein
MKCIWIYEGGGGGGLKVLFYSTKALKRLSSLELDDSRCASRLSAG